MSKKKRLIDENRNLYKIPGGANYQLRTKNAIHISPACSIKHEIAKCLGAYMIRKWGDVKFNQDILNALEVLDLAANAQMYDWPKIKGSFITEAVIKKQPDRRVDLVVLDDNTHIEFETSKKIKKEGAVTIYLE